MVLHSERIVAANEILDDRSRAVPGTAGRRSKRLPDPNRKGDAMRVVQNTRPMEGAPVRGRPITEAAKRAGRFGIHVMEMCIVMCVGLGLLLVTAAVLGFADFRQQAPELSALLVATVLAASMVVWMRFRDMAWRPTLEMAGSAVAAGSLMVVGHWLGVVPASALIESVCGVACVAMIAVMLFRFRLYSGHTSHHAHPG